MSRLAIVIPAYKSVYLDKTLLSVANQTCHDFTLYIGNDFSPYDLKSQVDLYSDRINICYHEFKENLGGRDLVAQWERCIDMVQDEEWIWLFSDDDLMDSTCVERFYATLEKYPFFDLFHFNVTQIDENGSILKELPRYPKVISCEEYLERRLDGYFYSFVVEYIFKRSHFYEVGRFENFDLGWASDDATWIKLSNRKGILSIDEARVFWRQSQYNITPNYIDHDILRRKFASQVEFAKWIRKFAETNKLNTSRITLNSKLKNQFFKTIKDRIKYIPFRLIRRILSEFYLKLFQIQPPTRTVFSFYFLKISRSMKAVIKKLILWDFIKQG